MRPTGSIRRRPNGKFEIIYSLGYDQLTGKRHRTYKAVDGTYNDAQKELRRILRTIDTQEYVKPTKKKVGQFLAEWLEVMRSRISPKTYERYANLVNHFLIPAFGAAYLTKLEPEAIQSKYADWETSGRRDRKPGGLAPRTRLHIHRVFKLALKQAVRLKQIASNPADHILAPRARRSKVSTLSVEQCTELLEALRVSHPRVYWPVFLAVNTGMRRGEVVALRWKNVDFENKTVRVVESVEQVGHNIRFKEPKTERTRAVVLPDYAAEELKAWKEKQAEELKRLSVTATDETFVCGRSWDGNVLKPDSLTQEFRVAIRDVPNFPIVRFHDLRHSHATQLLQHGVNPKITQERLGHSTIATTLDLYSHVVNTMQNDAAAKLDSIYRSAIKARSKNTPD